MGPLLLLETSTRSPSMLFAGGREAVELRYPQGVTITQVLARGAERLLGLRGLVPGDLGAVGVGVGPGSYTGLRCGLAWAKALVLGTGGRVELLGVPSLLAWAVEASHALGLEGLVTATANAYQGDAYLRVVTMDDGSVRDAGADEVLALEELPSRVSEPALGEGGVTVLGFGCGILKGSCREDGRLRLVPDAGVPTARALYRTLEVMGREPFRCEQDELKPLYLRPSGAEIKVGKSKARRTQED